MFWGPNYLPRLAKQYGLLDQATEKQFAATMRKLVLNGRLKSAEIGRYPNRSPKLGLVCTDA